MRNFDSIKSGNYNLTLNAGYQDCAWKMPDYILALAQLTVEKSGETVAKPNITATTTANIPSTEPIVNISASAPAESKGIPSVFVTIVAIAGVILLFGLVYFLEFRSRTIY